MKNVRGIENSVQCGSLMVEASHLDQSFCRVMVHLGQVRFLNINLFMSCHGQVKNVSIQSENNWQFLLI